MPERSQQIVSEILALRGETAGFPAVLCRLCAQEIPVTGAGLALMSDDGHGGVVGTTDGAARILEDLQFTLGEGPCLDASRDGYPVLQPDLAATGQSRWPGLSPDALDAGIAALFAFPLQVGRVRVGVLDLYRDTPGYLDDEQLMGALAFADAALWLMLDLPTPPPDYEAYPDLADPLGQPPEIHQATGMVAVQAAVGMADALLLLRGRAFSTGRSVRVIARDVIARRFRFENEGGAS